MLFVEPNVTPTQQEPLQSDTQSPNLVTIQAQ